MAHGTHVRTHAHSQRSTGDVGELTGSPPYWRLLGRASADIIKSGGYKISALQARARAHGEGVCSELR